MAWFRLTDYFDFGTKGYHTATTWEVALDPGFTQVIDRSIRDTINLNLWNSPLPKLNGDGYYGDLDNIYVRVKLHVLEDTSDWFYLTSKSQNKQNFIITKDGETVSIVDESTVPN